jgi:hypothetical protein
MAPEFKSIIHRHSFVSGVVPSPTEIYPGELAINLADQKLYTVSQTGTLIDLTLLNSYFNLNNAQDGYVLTFNQATGNYSPQPLGGFVMGFDKLTITNLLPIYELGEFVLGSGVATWVTNGLDSNWQPDSGYLSVTLPNGVTSDLLGPFNPTVKNRTIAFPSFVPPTNPLTTNTLTFSIRGSRIGGDSVTPGSLTSVWRSKIYYGKSSNSNLTTPTFDVSEGIGNGSFLNTSNLKGPTNQAVQVGSGPGYFYLFIHDAYTLDDTGPYYGLKYGGNLLVKDDVTTVELTNSHGVTSTYKRYRSTNILNDSLTVIINPTI